MSRNVWGAVIMSAMFAVLSAGAWAAPHPTIVTADAVKWTAGTGELAGVQVAMLEGNPSAAGPYALRLKIPSGMKFPAHFHGDVEHVTVLKGTLMVGLGDTMVPAKMTALPAGSYASVPIGVHHYAMAKGETIIQIAGIGPTSETMVKGAMK